MGVGTIDIRIRTLCALLIAVVFMSGTTGAVVAQEQNTFEGTITETSPGGPTPEGPGLGFTILLEKDPDETDGSEPCTSSLYVSVPEGVEILEQDAGKHVRATIEALEVGRVVRATFDDMATSCPGQTVATSIVILNGDQQPDNNAQMAAQQEMPERMPETGGGALTGSSPRSSVISSKRCSWSG